MTFVTRASYDQFIRDACAALDDMEKRLDSDVKEKRKRYFDEITREAVQAFFVRQALQNENVDRTDKREQRRTELKNAWDAFCVAADIIREKLDLEEVLLFGDGINEEVDEEKRKYLYPRPLEGDPRYRLRYDFARVADEQPTAYDFICSLESPEVLSGLPRSKGRDTDKANSILLIYPDIAVLLQVQDRNDNTSLYTEMANAIGRSFSRIYSIVALCAANLMKERHVLTLRMNRHESLHISTRLSDNMRRYLKRHDKPFTEIPSPFMDLTPEKQQDVVEDMQSAIRLITHMASNIGLITGSINATTIRGQEKKLDVFTLLYKWQVMFRDRLHDRNLELSVLRNDADAPRFIVTNLDLFELMVYNLVDNAVKYAHRGSNIRLAWQRLQNDSKYYLTVSSYGPEIKDEDKPFELYARGNTNTVDLTAVEGDGIGLYVVKRIERLLGMGLKVSYTCDEISQYNLPLISHYISEPVFDSRHKDKQAELQKYQQSVSDSILNDVINDSDYTRIDRARNLSKEYLDKCINRETWLTVFVIKVPDIMKG